MRGSLLATALIVVLLGTGSCGHIGSQGAAGGIDSSRQGAQVKRVLRLDGGFIQYWSYMMEWNWQNPNQPPRPLPYPIDWGQLVFKMHEAGMSTIVLQQLEYKEKGNVEPVKFYSMTEGRAPKPKPDDPTEKILKAADGYKMEVFLGLLDDKDWNYETPKKSPKELESYLLDDKFGLARKMTDLAQRVWELYHAGHVSFRGWYIPIEMWNFYLDRGDVGQRKKKIGLLRQFLNKVSKKCAELNRKDGVNRPVAIAPYFNPNVGADPDYLAPANVVEEIYAELLNGSGVNIVMLQDGVGARGLDPDSEGLRQFFAAFRNASKKAEKSPIEFWADVETYVATDKPTTADNLKKQLAAECGYASRFIAWDFYHYMNPDVEDCCADAQGNQVACKGAEGAGGICKDMYGTNIINTLKRARLDLYDSYKQEFVSNDFSSPNCPP